MDLTTILGLAIGIVAILLGYLRSIGQKQHFREVWIGVAVAAVHGASKRHLVTLG